MPSDIDASVPPWLSRNWSPREPFDPTPWLQERYRRQVQQAKLPLELQQMELQNAAAKLGIEHQGMVNELQGMQLQKYNEELPLFQQALNDTGGDPAKILNRVESFQSPLLQNQWNSLQLQAGKTIKGIALQQNVIRKFQAAARLEGLGAPPVALDENGMIDDESLRVSAEAYNKQRLAEINARNAWHYDENGNPIGHGAKLEPEIIEKDGVKMLFNRNTGKYDILNKPISRDQWIKDNMTRWMKEFDLTADEAATKLNEAYGKHFGTKESSEAIPVPVKPRYRWENGKLIQFQ